MIKLSQFSKRQLILASMIPVLIIVGAVTAIIISTKHQSQPALASAEVTTEETNSTSQAQAPEDPHPTDSQTQESNTDTTEAGNNNDNEHVNETTTSAKPAAPSISPTPQTAAPQTPSASVANLGRGGGSETSNSAPTSPQFSHHTTREETTTTHKYGTTILTTSVNTYEVYTDGYTKFISSQPKSTRYDFSTFNATAKELWSEAVNQISIESQNIQQILARTNYYRAEIGSDPLTLDGNLNAAANIRALEIAWSNIFSHTRPNGQNCFSLINEIGIPFYGENLAYGDNGDMDNGFKATEAWRHSRDHYFNMVDARFKKMGVGVYKFGNRYYYVQLFSE